MTKTKTTQQTKGAVEPLRPQESGAESALQRVIAQIEKQYGRGSIMQMDEHKYAKIESISTGALSLDIASAYYNYWFLKE